VGVLAGLALLLAGLLVFTPVGSHAQARALALWETGDPYREHVLAVAWRMFLDQPLLGVGSGRFARMFEDYSWKSAGDFQWGSLSAHNLYAQFLAEQGALGLLSFLAVFATVIVPVLRRQSTLGEERPAVLFLLVSLGAWLVYGLLQYTFLLRAMQIYVWITLGLVAALGGIGGRPRRVPRRLAVGVVVVLVLLVGLRVATAARRPAVEAGLHALEGGEVRWTRGEAVLVLPVEGPVLRLLVSCPIREVAGHPQTVTFLLDGRSVQQLRLDTPAWRLVEARVEKPVGQTVRLGVRTGYTFVPAALGVNEDDRRLGVLLGPIKWGR
jgi:O-antigen ligase